MSEHLLTWETPSQSPGDQPPIGIPLMLVQAAPSLISISSGLPVVAQAATFTVTKFWSQCSVRRIKPGRAFILNISHVVIAHRALLDCDASEFPKKVGAEFNALLPGQFVELGLGPDTIWAFAHR